MPTILWLLLAGLKAPLPDLSEVTRELDAAAAWRP